MPSLDHFVLLSLVGVFGGVANLWLSQSYKFSEVSLVTPLKYLALVTDVLLYITDEMYIFEQQNNSNEIFFYGLIIEFQLSRQLMLQRIYFHNVFLYGN